ncbi:MAG: alpha/beta hydrolase fold protein [Ramlibacter sp.]|nr:alpha/beta hydrolase fold protein [Ramlibacter sp.]MDB5911841.1 alpha/beta hydrolase fold protein [Ramlibacter sp.]
MTAAVAPDSLQGRRALLEERFPQRLVTLPSGARVAVRECGEASAASTLVLLHGISSGAASWLHAVLPLAGTRVIAWDAPGYGDSTALEQPAPRAADYAQRLDETLQALQVQRCVLVGHSLGALMACAYAAGPGAGRVARLVLISPARGYANSPDREKVRQQRTGALDKLGVPGLAAAIDQRLLSPAASPEAREWVRFNTSRMNPDGYRQAVGMLCDSELAVVPSNIPVEVHCGEADVVTTPAACKQAAQALGASFHGIAQAGHASPVEQPAAVASLLAHALAQAAGEGRHG